MSGRRSRCRRLRRRHRRLAACLFLLTLLVLGR